MRCREHAIRLLVTLVVVLSPFTAAGARAQEQPAGQDAATPAAAMPPAAAQAPVPPRGLESPRDTLRTFLTAMLEEDAEAAAACLDLTKVDPSSADHLADLLRDTLDRIEVVEYVDHPNERDVATIPRFRNEYVFFPRDWIDRHEYIQRNYQPPAEIVLARQPDGAWRFSADTIAEITELNDSLLGLPRVVAQTSRSFSIALQDWLTQLSPGLVTGKFLTVKYWQWIGLAILIFVGVTLDFSFRWVLMAIARRIIAHRGGEASPETLKRTVRPFGLALAAVFWLATVGELGLPPAAMRILMTAVRLFAMLAGVWAAFRLTDLASEVASSKAATTDTKFDDLLVPLIRKSLKVFIAAFGLIYIASSFNIEIAPLLTGLGIGGVGFAFAAKDSIENLFGSVSVIVDRPFQVGDWVVIGETEGTVEELGLRSVRIRTFYNSLVTIPTANLVRARVDNYGRRKYRRWKTHLNLTYDTPPDRIETFCEGIRELIRLHPYTRKDYFQVWLHQFGAHSLDVLIYVFHEAPDWQTELRERQRLILDILRLAERLGVQFAFPTQTLHVHSEPDATAETHEPSSDDRAARRLGRRAAEEMTADATWRRYKPGPYRIAYTGDDDDEDDETQIESKVGGDA